ncbi:unnamed protein product [Paramecium pentaurelia]|uniref:Uncharacterized protein n=1 Tax=Paramecium pentaurelia TaxID=43138 RepID=A0A8S1YEL4_9CILI|nr:unnamed protein product [Paramecium pentaurelia]
MQDSDNESQLLYQSIAEQQDDVEDKQVMVSSLTDMAEAQDESIQINFDRELISKLEEEIVLLQRKNIYLIDQLKDRDNQISLFKEKLQKQTAMNEIHQIAEVQLKQQIEELKIKITELHYKMAMNQTKIQTIPKINLDFSWVNHIERDHSHDGLLERYEQIKVAKRLAPIQVKQPNQIHHSPYFEQLTERKPITQRKRLNNQ